MNKDRTKKNGDRKIYKEIMLDLTELRHGRAPERIRRFFASFGCDVDHDPEKSLTARRPSEVAHVLGLDIKTYERAFSRLLEDGELVWRKGKGGYMGVAAVPVPDLDGEALDLLNKWAFGERYCNPSQEVFENLLSLIRNGGMPRVRVGSLLGRFPSLGDFSRMQAIRFWPKAAKAAGRNPALKNIKDPDLRLAVGIGALEAELDRILKGTPGWAPDKPEGWLLDGLARLVGAANGYPPRAEQAVAAEQIAAGKKGLLSLHDMAVAAANRIFSERQARLAGKGPAPEEKKARPARPLPPELPTSDDNVFTLPSGPPIDDAGAAPLPEADPAEEALLDGPPDPLPRWNTKLHSQQRSKARRDGTIPAPTPSPTPTVAGKAKAEETERSIDDIIDDRPTW